MIERINPPYLEIPLTRGQFAAVSPQDYERVMAAGFWTTYPSACTCYANQRTRAMHGFITGWAMVDHWNGDGLDNRRENLREATAYENQANTRSRNPSGFKGVYRNGSLWRAQITPRGLIMNLGRQFKTAEAAARAYDDVAREVFGEFASLNFPTLAELGPALIARKPLGAPLENGSHARRQHSLSASGFRGVYLRRAGRYEASAKVAQRTLSFGTHDTPEQAVAARAAGLAALGIVDDC